MAKYDGQIAELKSLLPNAKNILIALPAQSDIDKFAGGLALFLSLQAAAKEVSIVCDDTILVAQSHLFGVDHIQKNIPSTEGGNFVITLEDVAVPDQTSPNGWKVPALQNLDWYGENNNLNLVFHIVPGQTFQPTSVTPRSQGSGFNLIFVVGSADLNSLGAVYSSNQQAFSGVHIINIDNHAANTGFGTSNVVDQGASISEMMADLIPNLGLPLDGDTASNILAGIFDATANLGGPNVGPDVFLAVANCLRAGGKRPGVSQKITRAGPDSMNTQPAQTGLDLSALLPKEASIPRQSEPQPIVPPPVQNEFPTPPVVPQSLSSETPRGEVVTPGTEIEAEPDWLTPKVFKGSQG